MSVALVSIAWGDRYAKFVPRWWEMAQALDPAPDEIIIAHHPEDATGVAQLPVKLIPCYDRSLPKMLNAAIEAAESEWIQQCPLDDLLKESALTVLQGIRPDTDLVIPGAMSLATGHQWMGDFGTIWGSPSDYRMNHHAPIKKDLWRKVGGFGAEHWSDWAFFLRASAAGCHPEYANEITLLFDDRHDGRYSNLGGQAADEEIRKLQESLR